MTTDGVPSISPLVVERTRVEEYTRGAAAGLLGAAMLAGWFFVLDFGRGQPLFTPTVLGTALFRGREALASVETLPPSAVMTLAFTVVHAATFGVLGIAATLIFRMVQRRRHLILAFALLFCGLQVAFLAFALTLAGVAFETLSPFEVIAGNLWAAAIMAGSFWRWRVPSQES